jgi:hypothetical protein
MIDNNLRNMVLVSHGEDNLTKGGLGTLPTTDLAIRRNGSSPLRVAVLLTSAPRLTLIPSDHTRVLRRTSQIPNNCPPLEVSRAAVCRSHPVPGLVGRYMRPVMDSGHSQA